jgi:hypothetical protein
VAKHGFRPDLKAPTIRPSPFESANHRMDTLARGALIIESGQTCNSTHEKISPVTN